MDLKSLDQRNNDSAVPNIFICFLCFGFDICFVWISEWKLEGKIELHYDTRIIFWTVTRYNPRQFFCDDPELFSQYFDFPLTPDSMELFSDESIDDGL